MSNPVINGLDNYSGSYDIIDEKSVMTVSGTMNAFFIMGILTLLPALITWNWVGMGFANRVNFMISIGGFAGFVLGIIMCFAPKKSPYLAPLYAVCEGMLLGGISALMENVFKGIVVQTVCSTMVIVFAMFFLYKTGLIVVTQKLRSIIILSTLSVGILYLIAYILQLLGFGATAQMIYGRSVVMSVAVCIIASFNLLLDFDRIEYFSQKRVPFYMNWYCAYGLMLTIVWLYIEIMRLIVSRRSR